MLCRACRLAPPDFVRAVSFGPYDGRMKEAVHALKYDRLHPAAHRLGRMLAEAVAQLASEAPAEMLVVPVPLHKSKYGQRGFNKSRLLAVHALGFLGESHPKWRLTLASSTLMRLRATDSQAGLTPRMQRLNVRGAFVVSDPSAVDRKHLLLIDDILTTGATLRAATKALVRAGAASVWVATLARAYRTCDFGPGFSFRAEEEVQSESDFDELAGEMPDAELQRTSRLSSHDQPSF